MFFNSLAAHEFCELELCDTGKNATFKTVKQLNVTDLSLLGD